MLKLLKILTEYWKGAAAIIGICGALIGGYKYLEGIPKRAEEQKNEMIEVVKAYADTTSMHLFRVESALYEYGYRFDAVDKKVSIIQNNFSNHLKTEKQYEELFNFQQELLNEIKKNGIQIPYSTGN